jgi:hydrogenase nickel incorporation protein HypA/HybF
MHELSLSYATVDLALESIANLAITRVNAVSVIAGELSGVSLEAFRFSFPIAAQGTLLEGCRLEIKVEAVTVFCPACQAIGTLSDIPSFRCPTCGAPTADVRSGKEFALQSIDIQTAEVSPDEYANR